jgi:DNA-directed RNA polymerase specialized sigma24 family protein
LIIDDYRRVEMRAQKELVPARTEDASAPDAPLEFQLTRADLQVALAQLTEEQQAGIALRFDEGLTCAQVAHIIGKPETAVRAFQRRGLAALARWFAAETAASGVSAR